MTAIETLLKVMQELRDPEYGCPWDIKQTSASIAAYTLDETHELLDAIEQEDNENLKEELGDLLFNIVFHARIAEEKGLFNFEDVARGISDKMVRRHPHVFGELRGQSLSEESLAKLWQASKQQEKKVAGRKAPDTALSGNSAFYQAKLLQKEAAKHGFDWPDIAPVIDKLEEELSELKAAVASKDPAAISDELGDLIFVCVNVARHSKISAETALRNTNLKFQKRFDYVQAAMQDAGIIMDQQQLEQMESFWQESKSVVG